MQGHLWINLLRRVPATKHNLLVIVTATGMELMVQRIFYLEHDYVIMRARLAGSSDAGRIILLPYDEINSVAFNAVLPEKEVQTMFGDGQPMIASVEPRGESAALAAEPEPEPIAEEPRAAQSASPASPAPGDATMSPKERTPASTVPPPPPKISKSILLARLRARLNEQGTSSS